MQGQYLKLPRLYPDALSRVEKLLRDWECMAGTDNSVDGCAEELRDALYRKDDTGAAPGTHDATAASTVATERSVTCKPE